jgi:nitroreductase
MHQTSSPASRAGVASRVVSNEVFEAVRTVLAVREFQGRPVPEETQARIVEAARLTASAGNRQPWHFVVVTEPARLRELGKLVRTGPYIAEAPMAIAVAYEKETYLAVSDASRAIQSMVLTAWGEGIGSNWAGFSKLEAVRDLVHMPASLEVLAVVAFGYPKRLLGKGIKKRKPASEVISREQYGTPGNH